MGDDRSEGIDELIAEREIRKVLVRYSRGIDRCDEELIRSVYHADATDDHGQFKGSGSEFASWVVPILRDSFDATMHDLGNVTIELEADSARVETYVIAYHVAPGKDARRLITVGGRYLDRFECRGGEWKIARRVVVIDWNKTEVMQENFPVDRYRQGSRWPEDPSYEEGLR